MYRCHCGYLLVISWGIIALRFCDDWGDSQKNKVSAWRKYFAKRKVDIPPSARSDT